MAAETPVSAAICWGTSRLRGLLGEVVGGGVADHSFIGVKAG